MTGCDAPTIAEYAEKWLRRVRRAPGTLRCYRSNLDRYVLPTVGAIRLPDLRRRDVRALAELVLESGKEPNTAHSVVSTLSALCQAAMEGEIIEHNPCHGATRGLWEKRPEGEPKAPTWDEFCTLMEHAAVVCPDLVPCYLVTAYAGLRPGETLALRAQHVNVAQQTISVERTYHGAGRDGRTKGKRKRIVSVGEDLTALLDRLVAASRPPECWLFPGRKGYPWHIRTLEQKFQLARQRAGVTRYLTPHCLRHGCATWLLEDGVREVQIQRVLGHHSVQLTIDLYARGANLPPVVHRLERRHRGPLRASMPRKRAG